jgi:hypothetical protein
MAIFGVSSDIRDVAYLSYYYRSVYRIASSGELENTISDEFPFFKKRVWRQQDKERGNAA